jgi:EamA domain-containing membrane protein RarD
LAFNWGLYIYGVNSDRVIETSLEYFINPLVNVFPGTIVLRERLHWGQWVAVILAGIGVSYSVFSVGQIPWIALGLAFSFGFYGLSRKLIPVSPSLGLTVETCLLTPVALIYLAWQDSQQFGQSAFATLLLIGCGIVTSVPLFCFSSAAQILRLSTMGFFQYIAPSLQLTLGVWLYINRYPGFQDLIEYAELSTPLTVEHFDASDRGAIYGIPCTPARLDRSWIGARTPIKNLYLTGADAFSLGIMGAIMGGVKTAGILNSRFGFFKIMATIMRESALSSRDRTFNPSIALKCLR